MRSGSGGLWLFFARGERPVADDLLITASGGIAVASEELFALMDRLGETATHLAEASWRLRRAAVGSDLPGLGGTLTRLGDVIETLRRRQDDLGRFAEDSAAQERWRSATVSSTADRLLHAVVAGLVSADVSRAERTGREPGSRFDDMAAILTNGPPRGAHEVTVQRVVEQVPTRAPDSVAGRIARIPPTSQPIRIERYSAADGTVHTEVFIAGTDSWAVGTTESAFDLQSNLALIQGVTSASVIAVSQAMRHAGVQRGDPVTFTGHSQGGAIATHLAESGVYQTRGLITVGAPTGTLPVRGDYPALVIEHTDDIVPRLSGTRVPTQAVIVETRSDGGPGSSPHGLDGYLKTGKRVDDSEVGHLAELHFAPPGLGGGTTVTYTASRTTAG
jgi:hypothetical protein